MLGVLELGALDRLAERRRHVRGEILRRVRLGEGLGERRGAELGERGRIAGDGAADRDGWSVVGVIAALNL